VSAEWPVRLVVLDGNVVVTALSQQARDGSHNELVLVVAMDKHSNGARAAVEQLIHLHVMGGVARGAGSRRQLIRKPYSENLLYVRDELLPRDEGGTSCWNMAKPGVVGASCG